MLNRPLLTRNQGFTLIEVLIALLILSFGMLGLVGMQAVALKSNRDAKYYQDGTNLARDLAEMMRGNNLIAIKTSAADNPYLTDTLQTSNSAESCLKVGSVCSDTTKVAQAQMVDWRARVTNALPSPRVAICFDSEPYDANGLPQWTCTPGKAGIDEVVVLKLGWTSRNLDSSASDQDAQMTAASENSRPQIVIPVTGGNPFPL